MPHSRPRFIEEKILKKLKYSPVVAIQGARQTGKSFFTREILASSLPSSQYVSFDQESLKDLADQDIESFLAKYDKADPFIIDEAQKVPKVFDAIKFQVDKKRVPGKYLLLGSTEFSKQTQIRESLTGRITRVRFFPLTIAEALQQKYQSLSTAFFLNTKTNIDRGQLMRHLEQGGLPGLFAIRNEEEKKQAIQDWIDLTVHRDLHTFPKVKADSQLALRILKLAAQLEEPHAGNMAKELRTDLRRIKTHLDLLENLFVISKLDPHQLGYGKPYYYLLDVGIAGALGANFHRQLETLFLQQYLAKRSFDAVDSEIFYFRSKGGARVSFVEERKNVICGLQIFSESKMTKKSFFQISAFHKLAKEKSKKQVETICLASHLNAAFPKDSKSMVWEAIA